MANEDAKRDGNHVPVLLAITNDATQETRMLRVDPVTNRVLADASGSGIVTGSGTANQLAYFTSSSAISSFSNGTSGYVLTSNGAGSPPSFQALATGITIGSTVITGGTTGSVLFVGAASVIQQDNANFFWDDINNLLSLGSATNPAVARLYLKSDGTNPIFRAVDSTVTNGFFISADGMTLTPLVSSFNRVGTSGAIMDRVYTNSCITNAITPISTNISFSVGTSSWDATNITVAYATSSATSGTVERNVSTGTFSPASGTGVYNFYRLSPTINQTGGANGITRGLYINPTLTAAAAWTPLDIAVSGTSQYTIANGGTVSKYNSVSTTGWGQPAIYSSGRVTAQTAAIASVATYTVGAADGSFLVSANVLVTTATLHNFTVTVSYTDEGNTSRTLTLQLSTIAGAFITAITNAQGTVPYEGAPLHIRCKASTSITIGTTGTFTTVTYNAEGMITQIA